MTPPTPDGPASDIRRQGDAVIIAVQGDIDLRRSVEFQQEVLTVLDERPARVVVDLTAVPYMDSSGVASLVKVLSRARRQGAKMVLCGLNDRVRGLFEITRLDNVFTIAATCEEALG